ncbi:MAG: putative Haloacid dehalogenase domain protein hydrolase [Promethearchaeota archaeon]|nr:MAG: putative Haloacid dehalogenase domain protein hydrolase [Candidatus Lokiarchaeota archaeon]
MKNHKIEWLIFDAWGVIYTKRNFIHSFLYPFLKQRDPHIQEDELYKEYFKASRGTFASKDFWENIGFKQEYPEIEQQYLNSVSCLDDQFIEWIPKFKEYYRVALLSNDVEEWSKFLLQKYNITRHFEKIIISGEVGFRKPGVEIFEYFLEITNASPSRCVFVDDRLANLKASAEVGMNTIRFIRKDSKTPFCSEFEVGSFQELWHVLLNVLS